MGTHEGDAPWRTIHVPSLDGLPATSFIMRWLWVADVFPYPLWLIYKSSIQTTASYRERFDDHLWDVAIETMRGSVTSKSTTKVPFNRCKLTVCARSNALAADIYDREALTRMMAGFYWGLRLGLLVSWVAVIALIAVITSASLGLMTPRDKLGLLLALFIASFVFNTNMLHKVVKSFHILRMGEAEAVFESFVLVSSQHEMQVSVSEVFAENPAVSEQVVLGLVKKSPRRA